MSNSKKEGTLYLVATPIGNLKDITYRAIEVLNQVELIVCEDTRRARILLNAYNIKKPLLSYHDHNKEQRAPHIIRQLMDGKDIALITDAGTPGIADPGFYLVKKALEHNIQIVPIPGPTALISALSASGLPTDKFIFCGFLPRKKGKRQKLLKELLGFKGTIILYESPYRLLNTLMEIKDLAGENRRIVLARELTKIYEEFIRGIISEVIQEIQTRPAIKGEWVILIEGKTEEEWD